jgi:hypothetical protein
MSFLEQILLWLVFGSLVLAFVFVFLVPRTRWGLAPVGPCLIVASVGMLVSLGSTFQIVLFGENAEGMIVEIHLERRHEYVRVRYTTPEGNEVDFRSSQGIKAGAYRLNELVPVRYLTQTPTRAMIANRQSMYQPLTMGMLFSLALLIAAGFILRKRSARPHLRESRRSRCVPTPPPRGG